MSTRTNHQPQILAALSALLAMFASGIHFGWPNPSLPILLHTLTPTQTSHLTTISLLGDILGMVLSSLLLDKIGRKPTILLIAPPQIISMVLIASNQTALPLYIARFLGGTAEGASLAVLPVYVCEIAQPSIRGILGSCFTLAWCCGTLFITIVGSTTSVENAAWASLVVPFLFLATFPWQPESPYYCLMKNDLEGGTRALERLRGRKTSKQVTIDDNTNKASYGTIDARVSTIPCATIGGTSNNAFSSTIVGTIDGSRRNARVSTITCAPVGGTTNNAFGSTIDGSRRDARVSTITCAPVGGTANSAFGGTAVGTIGGTTGELAAIMHDVTRQMSESGTWSDLVTIKANFQAMLIMNGLIFIGQFTGMAVVIYNAQLFFVASSNLLPESWAAVILVLLQLVATIVSVLTIDWIGRRLLVLLSIGGCCASLITLTVFFYLKDYSVADVGERYSWVPLATMLIFAVFYNVGIANVINCLLGEIFSVSIKAKAILVSNVVYAVTGLISTVIYQSTASVSLAVPFGIFAVCQGLGLVFAVWWYPETKGKSLEEIQQGLTEGRDRN